MGHSASLPLPLIYLAHMSSFPQLLSPLGHVSVPLGSPPTILTSSPGNFMSLSFCRLLPIGHALALGIFSVFAISLDSDLSLSNHSLLCFHTPSLSYFPPLGLLLQPDFQLLLSRASPPLPSYAAGQSLEMLPLQYPRVALLPIFFFFFFNLFNLFLFLAALGLCCCVRALSGCGERGLLFVAVRRLLIAVASLVAEHGLYARRLQ